MQPVYKLGDYLLGLGIIAGLENLTDDNGILKREIEHTIYAELADMAELSAAYHVETHEQWKVPLGDTSKIRARIRGVNNRAWYLTTKTTDDEQQGCDECTTVLTKQAFDQWKLAATDGYIKDRHLFRTNVEGLIYEVDVFKDRTTGKAHPWVKIDLEVKDLNTDVPKLPFRIKSFVVGDDNSVSFTDRVRVRNLWARDWARLDDPDLSNTDPDDEA